MIVDLDEFERARAYIRAVNSCPLDKVVWQRGSKTIDVPKHYIDEWQFIGLSNSEFAEMQVISLERKTDV